jgi:hypothetical protein
MCVCGSEQLFSKKREREREREREANIVGKKDAVSTAHNYINYNVSIALSIPL